MPDEYRVTLGMGQVEDHPCPWASLDGWLTIVVPSAPDSESVARRLAYGLMDSKWSMIYTADEFNRDPEERDRWWPKGELARIEYR